jgi:1,4-dihydroxy-2-naphthoate octaprenyltransferase
VNKRTLPVRFGKSFARLEIAAMALLPFILNLTWLAKGWYWAGLLPFLILPIALKLLKNIFTTEPSSVYNNYLAQAAKLQLGFGVLLTVGFLIK